VDEDGYPIAQGSKETCEKAKAEYEATSYGLGPKAEVGTFWHGLNTVDDFGVPYKSVMIDGKTRMGPWACMTEESWAVYGVGRLGTGLGQKYERQADGRWLKTEG
jgi:hypothetical protein